MKRLIPICLLLAALALAGCTNPDAPSSEQSTTPSSSPQNPGEPTAPAPLTPAAQAPAGVQLTPAKALAAFSQLYIELDLPHAQLKPAHPRRDVRQPRSPGRAAGRRLK